MKCPNCGAEIENSKFCAYCGASISTEMLKEQELLNKSGCPKCGSTNVSFKRENQGEIRGKNSKKVIHRTVGVCKDCGETWYADNVPPKKRTWLWVLGWICIFPVPLTILLLRKKDMNNILKHAIIAIAWILCLVIAFSGGGNSASKNTDVIDSNRAVNSVEENVVSNVTIELIAGETGQYGKEIVMSEGTEFEEKLIVYYVPAGQYSVKNIGEYPTQVTVYEGFEKNNETGYDEYTNTGSIIRIDVNETGEIDVPDGWFIEIHEPAHIMLSAK